jgi:PAS domain S-box-containing protein
MKKNNNISSEAAELRRKAEERLKKISKKAILPKTNEELLRLVHELQTHQIELEMINEELQNSREDVVEGLQQYTDLYDFAPVGYFNLKRDGTICRANLTGASMLGVDRSKLMNSRFGLFVSEETRPAFNELLQKVFESKIKTSCEVSLLKEGNELLYVHIDATADIDGQECKMTMVDITGRKQAEESLRESELRFKQVSESAHEWIWEVDSKGKYTYASPVIKELLGYEAEEIVGIKYFYDFFDPENKEEIKQAALEGFARKESIRNFINCNIHKDGRKIILSTTGIPILDKGNNLIGYRGTDVDVTERLRAEEAIKESEERFRSLFENSTMGLYRTTPQGDILLANPTMIRMLGFDNIDELAQRNLEQKGYEPDYPRSKFQREIEKSGYIIGLESKWTKKDGTTLDIRESAHAIRDSNGKTLYYDGTVEDITERKKAEEEIQNLAKFPSENPSPILRIARDGTLLFMNEAGVNLLADWHLQVGKEAPPMMREAVFQSMHNVTTQVLDLEYGEKVYSFHIAPIVAADYANLYGRDITERLRGEEALHKSEKDLKEAQRVGRLGSWDWNTTTNTIIWSEELYHIVGFDPTQPPPGYEEYLKLYTPESAAWLDAAVKESLQTGEEYQLDLEQAHPEGTNHWITVIGEVKCDDKGQIVGLRGTAQDITVRKNAEVALKESEQRYRSVAKSATDAIITTNGKGIIINWNIAAEKIFGYTQAEITGKNLTTIIPQNYAENHVNGMKHIEQDGEYHLIGKTVELMGLHKSGNEFPLELSLSKWETKKEKFFTGIIRDITVRKRAEKELIAAKEKAESANKLKDAFIANISHEIRTPLTGILGMTSIIRDTFHDKMKKEDEELFEGIDISSKRIIRTVDMILNYSRLQVGEFQIRRKDMELSPICENLVKEFTIPAKFRSLELTFQNNCGDVNVLADEYSLTMAISNLIDNAIKFTNKGLINVILYKGNNDDIILDVKDTGIGISDEYLEMMFEPYQQEQMGYGRAYEGVGLGLSLVKKVLDLNNIKVFVKSKKSEGTTFSINFGKGEQPLEVKYKKGIVPNIIPAPEELRKELVLLVEDDLMNQLTIRRFIENRYIVIITDSSDEALEILNKNKVDIILMDISIWGKKNGLELTKELKASKEFSHIPVIAITAHAFEEDKQNALEAGCDNYLAKPFSKESLLEMIAGFVRI